jgi:hypothetical protein
MEAVSDTSPWTKSGVPCKAFSFGVKVSLQRQG